jgi:uncharacterized protein YjbI with pentapeptide repeats
VIEDESYSNEDWCGEELLARSYRNCLFSHLDLTEAINEGSVFENCSFRNVKFNASRHADAAFLHCTLTGCNFFDDLRAVSRDRPSARPRGEGLGRYQSSWGFGQDGLHDAIRNIRTSGLADGPGRDR